MKNILIVLLMFISVAGVAQNTVIRGLRVYADQRLNTPRLASDPVTFISNGSVYYNTTTNKLRVRQNGAWVDAIGGALDATPTNGSANGVESNGVFDALALKSNIGSPTFTGVPAAPTAAPGTNTTQLATTAFVLANGGVGTLTGDGTATRIPYYTATQVLGNSDNIKYDNSIKTMILDSNTFTKNKYTILSNVGSDNPPLIEFRRVQGGSVLGVRGQIGAMGASSGNIEMNISANMDYSDNSHKYFNPAKGALWSYLHNEIGWGLQWTKGGHSNNDSMWSHWGRVIHSIDIIPHSSTGEAVTGGSRVKLQEIDIIDANYTSPTVRLNLSGTTMNWNNLVQMNLPATTFAKGGALYSDASAIATFKTTGANTYVAFINEDNSGAYNFYRFLKNKAGSYNLGALTKVIEFDINGGTANEGWMSTASVNGGFSTVRKYWTTTNSTGTTAERMTLTDDGQLRIGTPGDQISTASLLELWNPSATSQLSFNQTQANTNFSRIYVLKNRAGDWDAMSAGDKGFEIDLNTLGAYKMVFNSDATGGFRAFDHVFSGTDAAGTTADRFKITGRGNVEILGGQLTITTQFTPANSTDATYPVKTFAADDSFLYYRKSDGTWVKSAWVAF